MAAGRNLEMAARIEAAGGRAPFSFVVIGDSGAWPDPTADAIFRALVGQVAALEPAPLLLANLGDFAGPGTLERHEHYLGLVSALGVPDVCIVGNHDLDAPGARAAWTALHGPAAFSFAAGGTRFVALDAPPVETPEGTLGPGEDACAFLDATLRDAEEPHRVVLMHCPPLSEGASPRTRNGASRGERAFLDLLRSTVSRWSAAPTRCSSTPSCTTASASWSPAAGDRAVLALQRGVRGGAGRPADRGSLFHAVQLTIGADGGISGRVLQAFDAPGRARLTFG